MKKRPFVLLLAIIILTAAVHATDTNFTIQKSYDWLLKQESNGSYGGVIDTSAAILALKAAGYNPTNSIDYLAAQENAQFCWPKASCKTKETAFVLLAYKLMGVGSDDVITWMKNAQSAALQSGNWWLEVATTDTGTCTIKYTKNNQEISKTINVNNGRFSDCGNTTFMNINNCIEANFVKNYPTIKIYVDCGTLSNALISLIYNSANSYYLLTDSQNKVAEITIENGCFGIGYKDPICNYESTLYANWALDVNGVGSSSKIYLRDNYDKTNTLHNALLYLILKDNTYLDELKARQRSDGSWDGDVYRTAMAVLAMKGVVDYSTQFNNGVNWLETKQRADGSFGDVTTTAMVLYAAFTESGGVQFPSCTNGIKDIGERGIDCGGTCEQYDDCCQNNVQDEGEQGVNCGGVCQSCENVTEVCNNDGTCDKDRGEDCHNCPDDCKTCEVACNNDGICGSNEDCNCADCNNAQKCLRKEVCDNNGVCDYNLVERGWAEENENSVNCPNDCKCGDGICDDKESYETCPQDCTKNLAGCGDGTCDATAGETSENCAEDCGGNETVTCNNDGTCDNGEGCDCADCKDSAICKQPSKFPWMWVLILFVLLLVVVAYLIMKKKGGKKKPELFGFGKPLLKKPEFKPIGPIKETKLEKKGVTITMPTRAKEEPSRVEKELEKSIKEAKKLVEKK